MLFSLERAFPLRRHGSYSARTAIEARAAHHASHAPLSCPRRCCGSLWCSHLPLLCYTRSARRAMLRQRIPLRHNRIHSSRRHRNQRAVPSSRYETHTLPLSNPSIPESTASPLAAAQPRLLAPSNNRHRRKTSSPASRCNLPSGKEAERKPAMLAARRGQKFRPRLERKQETPPQKKLPNARHEARKNDRVKVSLRISNPPLMDSPNRFNR